ncbi:MAG: hypothetical protein QOI10_1582 [Solirubrobacterales bacterium]|nr:hypothetical protein [Solirubrobacterales bacterium]
MAGVFVFLFVAGQILIPGLGERQVEERLTAGGGSADVTLGAFPAARLLFGDGERLEVTADDLNLALDRQDRVFDDLDGFTLVDVSISNSTAGPFRLASFKLHRDGAGPYDLTATGSTSPSSLVDYGVRGLEIPGGDIADLALNLLGIDTNVEVPIDLDMQLTSDDGRVQVVSGGGTVAGLPTGPLAELLTSAIVVNL